MKNLKDKILESKFPELTQDNLLAIMCAVKALMGENVNYSMELKTNHINPTISEEDAFEGAQIIIDQKIWEI